MTPLRLRVWSDYLCPWCYNASVRLARLERELGPALELEAPEGRRTRRAASVSTGASRS